ncbi:hypothetical protein AVEN_93841-1 [Araneus ventricosus]|uniref:Uncharacterized protein n=1 Tax=Araneus ventricosus TaxID=182803 RepID=A0A4Y2AYF5_ARAVE|nr:hypothetical protein AVEN_93841-1 [Araneus ventricosus]
MIGEDLQKFSGSRVMRTIAIGRVPIRNLPKMANSENDLEVKSLLRIKDVEYQGLNIDCIRYVANLDLTETRGIFPIGSRSSSPKPIFCHEATATQEKHWESHQLQLLDRHEEAWPERLGSFRKIKDT